MGVLVSWMVRAPEGWDALLHCSPVSWLGGAGLGSHRSIRQRGELPGN